MPLPFFPGSGGRSSLACSAAWSRCVALRISSQLRPLLQDKGIDAIDRRVESVVVEILRQRLLLGEPSGIMLSAAWARSCRSFGGARRQLDLAIIVPRNQRAADRRNKNIRISWHRQEHVETPALTRICAATSTMRAGRKQAVPAR
jgi:hypothetical protein